MQSSLAMLLLNATSFNGTFSEGSITNNTHQENVLIISPFNIAEIILCCLILITNIPLLGFIIYHDNLRRKKTNQIFINLQIVHLLHTCLLLGTKFTPSLQFYWIYALITQGLVMECFVSMSLLTYERFYVVHHPLAPESNIIRRVIPVITFSWIFPVIFFVVSYYLQFTRLQYLVLSTILVFLTGVGLAIANIKIYIKAKRHVKFVREHGHCRKVSKVGNMLKASFVCFAIVSSYIILWFLYFVRNVGVLARIYNPKAHGDYFSQIALFLAAANSLVDPLSFTWLNATISNKLRGIVRNMMNNRVSTNISTVARSSSE